MNAQVKLSKHKLSIALKVNNNWRIRTKNMLILPTALLISIV